MAAESPDSAPLIGLGLDYAHRDVYPGKLEGLCTKYIDRVSHLSIAGIEANRDAVGFRRLAGELPVIHHLLNIAPADLDGPDLAALDRQDTVSRSLDAVWCGEDIGLWSLGGHGIPYFTPPLFDAHVLEAACAGVEQVRDRVTVPFLCENPSCSFVAGELSLGEFFTRLLDRTGCSFVLDLSHLFSYCGVHGQIVD